MVAKKSCERRPGYEARSEPSRHWYLIESTHPHPESGRKREREYVCVGMCMRVRVCVCVL